MWRDYTKYSKIKKKDASLASTVWFLSTITWNACIFEIRAYYKLFVACHRNEQVWIQVGWAFSIFRQSRYHGLTLSWVQGCSRSSGLGGLMLELRLITIFVDQCWIVLLLFIIVLSNLDTTLSCVQIETAILYILINFLRRLQKGVLHILPSLRTENMDQDIDYFTQCVHCPYTASTMAVIPRIQISKSCCFLVIYQTIND